MKVLILGISRSGTNSLRNAFYNQGYHTIGEPFNQGLKDDRDYLYPLKDFNIQEKVCVKGLCNQSPINIELNSLEFNKKFINDFDKVILLDRKNIEEHKESFLHLEWRISNNQAVNQKWTSSIIPESFRRNFEDRNEYQKLFNQKEELKEIADFSNIPITYYEDIYGEDRTRSLEVIKSWGIDLDYDKFNEDLNPKYKLRQFRESII